MNSPTLVDANVVTQKQQTSPQTTPGPERIVPLNRLQYKRQRVECPKCQQPNHTLVEGRSAGKKMFMNVFFWPLPGRKYWWETIHWYCEGCNVELAKQKGNDDIEVLV